MLDIENMEPNIPEYFADEILNYNINILSSSKDSEAKLKAIGCIRGLKDPNSIEALRKISINIEDEYVWKSASFGIEGIKAKKNLKYFTIKFKNKLKINRETYPSLFLEIPLFQL